MDNIRMYIGYVARIIEMLGILVIVGGIIFSLSRFMLTRLHVVPWSYKILRQELGRTILLGLEILVAGDIIATVVTEPTMERVLTLAVIVLIRTFLSLSLEVELNSRFPWQKLREEKAK